MLRHTKSLIGFVLLAIYGLACANMAPEKATLLYTQTAPQGTIKTVGNKTLLTMKNVTKKTVWFTDRPARQAGTLSMKEYLNLWKPGKNSFSDDAPNALLMYSTKTEAKKGHYQKAVVKLSYPIYNISNKTLSYQITSIEKNMPKIENGTYYEIMLFIDDEICMFGKGTCIDA